MIDTDVGILPYPSRRYRSLNVHLAERYQAIAITHAEPQTRRTAVTLAAWRRARARYFQQECAETSASRPCTSPIHALNSAAVRDQPKPRTGRPAPAVRSGSAAIRRLQDRGAAYQGQSRYGVSGRHPFLHRGCQPQAAALLLCQNPSASLVPSQSCARDEKQKRPAQIADRRRFRSGLKGEGATGAAIRGQRRRGCFPFPCSAALLPRATGAAAPGFDRRRPGFLSRRPRWRRSASGGCPERDASAAKCRLRSL